MPQILYDTRQYAQQQQKDLASAMDEAMYPFTEKGRQETEARRLEIERSKRGLENLDLTNENLRLGLEEKRKSAEAEGIMGAASAASRASIGMDNYGKMSPNSALSPNSAQQKNNFSIPLGQSFDPQKMEAGPVQESENKPRYGLQSQAENHLRITQEEARIQREIDSLSQKLSSVTPRLQAVIGDRINKLQDGLYQLTAQRNKEEDAVGRAMAGALQQARETKNPEILQQFMQTGLGFKQPLQDLHHTPDGGVAFRDPSGQGVMISGKEVDAIIRRYSERKDTITPQGEIIRNEQLPGGTSSTTPSGQLTEMGKMYQAERMGRQALIAEQQAATRALTQQRIAQADKINAQTDGTYPSGKAAPVARPAMDAKEQRAIAQAIGGGPDALIAVGTFANVGNDQATVVKAASEYMKQLAEAKADKTGKVPPPKFTPMISSDGAAGFFYTTSDDDKIPASSMLPGTFVSQFVKKYQQAATPEDKRKIEDEANAVISRGAPDVYRRGLNALKILDLAEPKQQPVQPHPQPQTSFGEQIKQAYDKVFYKRKTQSDFGSSWGS